MATNLVYSKREAATTFRGAGGDVLWTPQNVAAGAGRISAVWDRGANAAPSRYIWRMQSRWAATPAEGNGLRLYLFTSSATATPGLTDGGLTFGDAGIATEDYFFYACHPLGQVTACQAADQLWCGSGVVSIFERYIGVGGFNGSSTKALTNTETDHILTLTPVSDDIQAAV